MLNDFFSSEQNSEIVIIIPTYKPNYELCDLIEKLLIVKLYTIIVVDDGSGIQFKNIFEKISSKCHLLIHAVNLGKGAALKTAFNYALLHFPRLKGVVTADADGQHDPKDILIICEQLKTTNGFLIIGSRVFKKNQQSVSSIPFRSKFGNVMTRHIFKFLTGRKLNDTQSGLRGIENKLLPELMNIQANKYEFELEMLIKAQKAGYKYKEVPIDTIYINHNQSSHFQPLLDSLKIYYVFLRYTFFSIATAIIDNVIFALCMHFSSFIIGSLIIGRFFACIFQFFVNKVIVFKSKGNIQLESFKYLLLVLINLCFSYFLIGLLMHILVSPYISKIIAESLIFIVTFSLQKIWIFSTSNRLNLREI